MERQPEISGAIRAAGTALYYMRQTPPIPDNCQWAIFLRNHDELTLEMVTDEERDYMLRDEKNAEYRAVIRNTIEFDPEILKRYVNFMTHLRRREGGLYGVERDRSPESRGSRKRPPNKAGQRQSNSSGGACNNPPRTTNSNRE